MKFIDLRSDTVTYPTPEMRIAMASAEVGDDVYGDDPTVNRLQELAAEMLGKEAALFVPSGTMGNQLAIMSHTQRSNEIILSDCAHVAVHESGAAATLSAVMLRSLHYEGGIPVPSQIKAAIRPTDIHMPVTGMIEVEEPLSIGKLVPIKTLEEIYELAHANGIPVHMDGARVFHAAAALNADVKDITKNCDSIMACLSKGLCAPVGSILAGSREFIARALRNRKMLGGGMRQAGILAAAGIIALEKMTKRLNEDHENAKYMAKELMKLPCVELDFDSVEINMVFFKLKKEQAWQAALPEAMLAKGIKINAVEDGMFRFVTSNDISRGDIDKAIAVLTELLQA
ncbi:MAG: low-specificity L-threonine aldolase [Hydrogenoanaerobacterium sp.]